MRTLAVVPARGGSKGIPDKNLRKVMGISLVERAVMTCLESDVDTIAVSTDSEEIARLFKNIKVEVVIRPEELSTDTVPSELAVLHAIDTLGWDGEKTLMVQCSSPLTIPADINGVIDLLNYQDSVFTVVQFHGFVWRPGPYPVNHETGRRKMRQETSEYVENGAIYGFHTDGFLNAKNRFFGDMEMYIMPEERWLEIDEPWHLALAEMVLKKRISTNSANVRGL